jgi:aminoglycoside phosphotransferase (APT) family kinase protein
MRSPTQRDLAVDDVVEIVRSGLGPVDVRRAVELSGGGFAAVWRVDLADRSVVVKVGPPAGAPLLGYEAGMIESEAAYFRLVRSQVPSVPVPEVLHLGDDWLITTLLPGVPLTEVPDGAAVRAQLGAAVAQLHTVTGPRFGYTGDRPSGDDWPSAFAAILDRLRADAASWDVPLPPLDGLLERHQKALRQVTRPALVHFDLWDGNVLSSGGRLTGLVDGERFLYGDPLIDLVSPALYHRIEDQPDHPFLRGYGIVLDDAARTRLALYRLWFHVLMLTEEPSRGLPVTGARHSRLTGLLDGELAALRS